MNDHKRDGSEAGMKRLGKYLRAVFDFRAGAMSTLVMASVVWFINMAATTPPNLLGSTTAALKQGVFTFFFSGLVLRLGTWIASRPGQYAICIIGAVLAPATLSIGVTYFVHSLRGTPTPFFSTLPTIFLSLIFYPIWAIYQRRKTMAALGYSPSSTT